MKVGLLDLSKKNIWEIPHFLRNSKVWVLRNFQNECRESLKIERNNRKDSQIANNYSTQWNKSRILVLPCTAQLATCDS